MLSLKKEFIRVLFFFVVGIHGLWQPAYSDIESGVNFLIANQQLDGSVASQSSIASDFQSTAESLRASEYAGGLGQLDSGAATGFLDQSNHRNTEALARLIILSSISGSDTQALFNELFLGQNTDGGFGDYQGFSSTALDTAFALDAIAEKGSQLINSTHAVSYLINRQQADGSWIDDESGSNVYTTALAMRALWHYRDIFQSVSPSLTKAQQYLLNQRNPNTGLWEEVYLSALSLIALIPNATEFSQVEAMVNELLSLQLADGSWQGDTYLTALAVRALRSQTTPVQPTITTGIVTGAVVNQTTGLAIADASIEILELSLTASSNNTGNWTFADLPPGEYSLRITSSGYAPVNMSDVSITAGITTDAGDILLSEIPTTGVLQGVVTEAGNNAPVDGAIVLVSGAANASIASNPNGNYSLVGLDPGQVVITVAKPGYLPLSTPANIVAGGSLIFNPVISPVTTQSEADSTTNTTGSIRGIVTGVANGEALQSAYVLAKDRSSGHFLGAQYTSADGSYQIDNLDPGHITLSVSKSGYIALSANATVYAGNYVVFSPGLVTVAGDPANATGEASVEAMSGTVSTGRLLGTATDQQTSLPLQGVAISVTGSTSATAVTGADGSYSLPDLVPGEVQVSATLNGYQGLQGTGTIVAGNNLIFNPEMMPDGFASQNLGTITGRVVRSGTGDAISYAVVQISDGANVTTDRTSSGGSFEFLDIASGNYVLTITRFGYIDKNIDVIVASDSSVDLGSIEMMRDLDEVVVTGQVLDQNSGLPIEDAVVSVSGSIISSQTDENGQYRLEGVSTGAQTLMVSATGYNSRTLIYSFPTNGEYELNHQLSETDANGVNITFLGTDRVSYLAYQTVTLQASVTNNGNPIEAMVNFTLFDEQGRLVANHAGTLAGETGTAITFSTGQITEVVGAFNTANLPPGDYRLIGRVEIGNQLVGPSTVILDEKTASISIEPTTRIERIEVDAQPVFSAVGNTENLVLTATIINRSNVDTNLRFTHRLTDPTGATAYTSNAITIPVSSAVDTLIVNVDQYDYDFSLSGDYQISLKPAGIALPQNVTGDIISVAPGLRVEPTQSLSPDSVTPDEDKRIRVNIRLQGMEVN